MISAEIWRALRAMNKRISREYLKMKENIMADILLRLDGLR